MFSGFRGHAIAAACPSGESLNLLPDSTFSIKRLTQQRLRDMHRNCEHHLARLVQFLVAD
jgi:hypothetical protein